MGNQAEDKAENGEAERKNRSTGRATERQGQEEGNGRNRRLSSQNRKRSGRKKAEKKGKGRKRKQKASTCGTAVGSEAGRDERKQTEKPSTGIWKESMRDQAGENGESEEAKAEARTGETTER